MLGGTNGRSIFNSGHGVTARDHGYAAKPSQAVRLCVAANKTCWHTRCSGVSEQTWGLGSVCGVVEGLNMTKSPLARIPAARGQHCQEISAFPFHTSYPDSIFLTQRTAD